MQSVTKQRGKKAAFQSSSPVFCTAKYRRGVRRTEGLKKIGQKYEIPHSSPAVSRGIAECHKNSVGKRQLFNPPPPVFCTAKYKGGVRRTEGLKKIGQKYEIPHSSPAVSRGIAECHKNSVGKRLLFNPPPLCFAQRNIGEVAEGRRG